MNAHLKIGVDPLLHTISDSKFKNSNIFKGTLLREESTYVRTKGNGKFLKENSKEIIIMGQSMRRTAKRLLPDIMCSVVCESISVDIMIPCEMQGNKWYSGSCQLMQYPVRERIQHKSSMKFIICV